MSQLSLFPEAQTKNNYLLMSIDDAYFQRIRARTKRYEYRRKFTDAPSTTFLYVNAPVSQVLGVVELARPIIAPVEEIADLAESQAKGSREGMLKYMTGLERGYAIPILKLIDIQPIGLEELRSVHPKFTPPQLYIRLANFPQLENLLLHRLSISLAKQSGTEREI